MVSLLFMFAGDPLCHVAGVGLTVTVPPAPPHLHSPGGQDPGPRLWWTWWADCLPVTPLSFPALGQLPLPEMPQQRVP